MNVQNSPYLSALQLGNAYLQTEESSRTNAEAVTKEGFRFQQVLETKVQQAGETGELKFSKHAKSRLEERNISLSEEQLSRLKEGTSKASGKGIKEPLVLIDNLAFIVSTGSNTVITAMGAGSSTDNIFTNIDGAVIN